MHIQARLKIAAFVPILLGCLILLGWFLTVWTLNQAAAQEKTVTQIVKAVFELNILAYEYAAHPAERPRVQWAWRIKSLNNMLNELEQPDDARTARLLGSLRVRSGYALSLLETLSQRSDEGRWPETGPMDRLEVEANERVVSQLLAQSQQMVQHVTQLADQAAERRRGVTVRSSTLMVIYVLILAGATMLISLRLSRDFEQSISRLRSGLEQLGAGDLSQRIEIRGNDEFSEISRSFNEMASALHVSRIQVEEELQKRTTAQEELHRLNETLEERVAVRTAIAEHRATQLRFLASELTLAEQRERRRIAQILHDHLGQLLVAAKMRASAIASKLPAGAREQTQQLEEFLAQAISASRKLMVDLSPPVLYSLGLEAAVMEHAEQLTKTGQLRVHVRAEEDSDTYPEDLRVILFQAVRELLFNVVKHSGTDEAWVEIRREQQSVRVSVEDHGSGFDPSTLGAAHRDHFGLFSLRERAELLGGRLEIIAGQGQGTRVSMVIPVSPEEEMQSTESPPTAV